MYQRILEKWRAALPFLRPYKMVFVLIGLFTALLSIYWLVSHEIYQAKVQKEQALQDVINQTLPTWDRKTKTDQVLRLGLISELSLALEDNYTFANDVEDRYYAVEKYMKPLVFLRSQMSDFGPHYVVNLGDSIVGEDQDRNNGADALEFLQVQLKKMGVPILWVIGNRDLRALNRVDFQEVTNAPNAPYVVDDGDYRMIVLDSNNNEDGDPFGPDSTHDSRGAINQEQLDWLEGELQTSKHVFIFMHHGAFDQSVPVAGKDNGKEKSIHNADELRALFFKYKVQAVFMSNMKSHAYEATDGVEFYALEDLRDYGHHPGAFYEVTIKGDATDVTLHHIDRDNDDSGDTMTSEPYKQDAFVVIPES